MSRETTAPASEASAGWRSSGWMSALHRAREVASDWWELALPWTWIPGLIFWAWATFTWLDRLLGQVRDPYRAWLLDWHVYAAGSRDFLNHQLYLVPLQSPYEIPVAAYNMPPGSAMLTLPFMPFPDSVGGALFVIVNIAAVGASAVLAARIMGLRAAAMWSGFAFLLYTLNDWSITAFLGNNTPILLLIVVGFIAARLSYRPTLAGVLLGVAIATKLWPAVFLAPLARERAWLTMAWAAGTAAALLGGALLWLGGPSAIGPMLNALSIDIEPSGLRYLLWITWLRVNVDWWPDWGGYAVAALLLLIPAKGRFGYGLAILAGMSAIPNLWRHYLPTMAFGLLLTLWGFFHRKEDESIRGDHVADEPVERTRRVAADPAAQP